MKKPCWLYYVVHAFLVMSKLAIISSRIRRARIVTPQCETTILAPRGREVGVMVSMSDKQRNPIIS